MADDVDLVDAVALVQVAEESGQMFTGGVDAGGRVDGHVLRERDRTVPPEGAETALVDDGAATGHRRRGEHGVALPEQVVAQLGIGVSGGQPPRRTSLVGRGERTRGVAAGHDDDGAARGSRCGVGDSDTERGGEGEDQQADQEAVHDPPN